MDKETLLRIAGKAMNLKGLNFIKELDDLYKEAPGYDYYRFAYFLAQETQPEVIVELGTQGARCSAHFAAGAPTAKVITIDGNDCSKSEPLSLYPNITFIQGQSCAEEVVNQVEDNSVDICFADTQHQTGHVLEEMRVWSRKMKKGALWLIDDLWEMPDLIEKIDLPVKGTLVGMHTCQVNVPENIVDVGFGYAIT
ncbi:MAG: CmcI family methyltransferase [Planctomycetota bacterium]|jgi:cephalosporin hydroxylase